MKQTVFISSTYIDLIEERKAVWELLNKFDTTVKGMEAFGARKDTPLDTCLNEVSQSDIYIGIIAMRLGSVEKNSGKSFTQLEYEKAIQEDKEILIYLLDEKNSKIKLEFIDFGDNKTHLDNFKTILKEKHTIDTFKNTTDLVKKLETRFIELLIPNDDFSKINSLDLSDSLNTINKFQLLPKKFSESKVQLLIQINGKAFPASKVLCERFSFRFGETVGVPIKIIEPVIEGDFLKELFVSEDLIDFYFNYQTGVEVLINATIHFSAEPVEEIEANLFEKNKIKYLPNQNFNSEYPETPPLYNSGYSYFFPPSNSKYIPKHIEIEGRAILSFSEVVKTDNNIKKKTEKI